MSITDEASHDAVSTGSSHEPLAAASCDLYLGAPGVGVAVTSSVGRW
jgi:hypothetical protein